RLSVQAIDTPLGVKTTIDQSSCNYDFSCMEGDCPSFMTVEVDDQQAAAGALGGSGERAVTVSDPTRTTLVASTSETPTGSIIGHPDVDYPELAELRSRNERLTTGDNVFVDAAGITERLFGSTATANTLLLGAAVQAGTIPIDPGTIERAIELNGVAVDTNKAAFRQGRLWVVAPEQFGSTQAASAPEMSVPRLPRQVSNRISEVSTS
ncbi:MAG: 2-oxoacid:acceptor oxidoreductase family protein, partial [Actinomycetota bacterium]|nr:2-oxoacid:acceptor oxidoreductase family protein [Actinomycetota bacterium]